MFLALTLIHVAISRFFVCGFYWHKYTALFWAGKNIPNTIRTDELRYWIWRISIKVFDLNLHSERHSVDQYYPSKMRRQNFSTTTEIYIENYRWSVRAQHFPRWIRLLTTAWFPCAIFRCCEFTFSIKLNLILCANTFEWCLTPTYILMRAN